MKNISFIVYDFDGVLAHGTNDGYFRCYHEAIQEFGIEMSAELVHQRIVANWGKSGREEVAGLIPEHPDLIDVVTSEYLRLLDTDVFDRDALPIAGALEVLQQVKERKIRQFIVSGAEPGSLERLSRRFGFSEYMEEVVSCSQNNQKFSKASGFHLSKLLEQKGLNPTDGACIGDSSGDVLMARRCAVLPIVVLTGILNQEQARHLEVGDILDSISALPSWLDGNS